MEMEAAIAVAISTFQSHTEDDNEVVFDALVAQGVSENLASRLIKFVPMAFTRHMLAQDGPRFPDTYSRMHEDGTTTNYRLVDQPVYRAALSAATTAEGGDAFLAVAGRSADFHAINQALQNGSQMRDLVLAPSVMLADGDSTDVPIQRRWWQFWR